MLDALPMPIWRRDANLDLAYCNEAYARAVGCGREELWPGDDRHREHERGACGRAPPERG